MVCFGSNSPPNPSLSLRQLLCVLRSPARRAQDAMLRPQSKFTPLSPLLIYVSHSSSKSPSFAMLIQGGVLCSPLVVYGWCITPSLRLVLTPPTANAYTTRSYSARLPARFGHIILSCGVQFEGNRGRGIFDWAISLRSVRNNIKGFSCRIALQLLKGTTSERHCDHTFWKKVG